MNEVITTQNLTKKYGKYNALDQVSIHVEKGGIYGLVGKNGAGKSTLFKLLMGLSYPTSGAISIEGSTTNTELNHGRKNIGFMMGTTFFSYLSARENIEYYRKLKGIADQKEVDRVLELVDMASVKKKFKSFSMGMKQRVAIANALLGKPDIIILDEPINGLDPQGIADIRKIVQQLNRENGITFLISSHILGELAVIGTRFGFIHEGRLVEELDAEELHEKTRHQLKVQVDNAAKAAFLLEDKLHTKNYRVLNDHELVMEDYLDKPDEVAEVFVNNGLRLKKLAIDQTSLEEYFLKMIGGIENV